MGDLNAKVGRGKYDAVVEPFGLGVSNKRDKKWND